MKSYDYEAVIYDGEIFCRDCLPEQVLEKDYEPIFADSEWDYFPVCSQCNFLHDYVNLTEEGRKRMKSEKEGN